MTSLAHKAPGTRAASSARTSAASGVGRTALSTSRSSTTPAPPRRQRSPPRLAYTAAPRKERTPRAPRPPLSEPKTRPPSVRSSGTTSSASSRSGATSAASSRSNLSSPTSRPGSQLSTSSPSPTSSSAAASARAAAGPLRPKKVGVASGAGSGGAVKKEEKKSAVKEAVKAAEAKKDAKPKDQPKPAPVVKELKKEVPVPKKEEAKPEPSPAMAENGNGKAPTNGTAATNGKTPMPSIRSDKPVSSESADAPVQPPKDAPVQQPNVPKAEAKDPVFGPENKPKPKVNGVQRGMELLAESAMSENLQEVKQLDTQLTHLNEKVDEMEKRLDTHHGKIQGMLNEQKAARLQRKSSFTQRMQETKAADDDWDAKVREMLQRVEVQRNFKPNTEA